ncbi:MAG: hypothetical protein LBH95_04840 [Oscillospiraceae bacterium]|jgi:hypothetical protein|nr:hypothetical protein [Oscillospiraceae bacterium]
MKRNLCLLLALLMLFAVAACAPSESPSPSAPVPSPDNPSPNPSTGGDEPPPSGPSTFLWDDFTDRDPNSKPDIGPNGASIWWDNWANMRASVEGGVATIQYRPKAFDPEDYDDEAAYYAAAGDWMGNWGEAIDMWSLDGIAWCKYLTIRIKGAEGGEEAKMIMDWHPEDSRFFAARFADLVLADGSNATITTDWQDLVIDLAASGFPGMTNALHLRAFAECTVSLDSLTFSEPVGPIDASSAETIMAGITVAESGRPGELPIRSFVEAVSGVYLWDDFTDRDPNSKPDLGPNGANIWWDNWANMRASVEDGVATIQYRPKAFDPEDYDDEAAYYAAAGDWMGNWGEAINMWALDGIRFCKYLTIRIKGAEGGEEAKMIMDWHPEDGKFYAARFADLVLKDGSKATITTDWQDLVIDLAASGFPGMTNALHLRAFAECTVSIDALYFSEPAGPIDDTSAETILAGMTAPETGKPGELPIKDFVAALK